MRKVLLISDYTPESSPNGLEIMLDSQSDFHLKFIKQNENERNIVVASSGTRYSAKVRRALLGLVDALEGDKDASKGKYEPLSHVYCEDCDYETESMEYKELIFKLSNEGGYIISDGAGGYINQCPKCKSENLILDSD
jgi:hypothetical protein